MSLLSSCFNTKAAAPSFRVAKWAAGGAVLTFGLAGLAFTPFIAESCATAALISGGACVLASLNGLRKGLTQARGISGP